MESPERKVATFSCTTLHLLLIASLLLNCVSAWQVRTLRQQRNRGAVLLLEGKNLLDKCMESNARKQEAGDKCAAYIDEVLPVLKECQKKLR